MTERQLDVPGARLFTNFVTVDEADELRDAVLMMAKGRLGRSSIESRFHNFRDGFPRPDGSVRALVERVTKRIIAAMGREGFHAREVFGNYYPREASLNVHRDSKGSRDFGVANLTVGNRGNDFTLGDLSGGDAAWNEYPVWQTRSPYTFFLPRRSLLVLDGDAVYQWGHGFAPLKHERVSMIVRSLVRDHPAWKES